MPRMLQVALKHHPASRNDSGAEIPGTPEPSAAAEEPAALLGRAHCSSSAQPGPSLWAGQNQEKETRMG